MRLVPSANNRNEELMNLTNSFSFLRNTSLIHNLRQCEYVTYLKLETTDSISEMRVALRPLHTASPLIGLNFG